MHSRVLFRQLGEAVDPRGRPPRAFSVRAPGGQFGVRRKIWTGRARAVAAVLAAGRDRPSRTPRSSVTFASFSSGGDGSRGALSVVERLQHPLRQVSRPDASEPRHLLEILHVWRPKQRLGLILPAARARISASVGSFSGLGLSAGGAGGFAVGKPEQARSRRRRRHVHLRPRRRDALKHPDPDRTLLRRPPHTSIRRL